MALARAEVPSFVLEQASQFGEIGAGIQLGPNVFRMFDRLGVREHIDKDAVQVEKLIMKDSLSAETITEVPLIGAFAERFGIRVNRTSGDTMSIINYFQV